MDQIVHIFILILSIFSVLFLANIWIDLRNLKLEKNEINLLDVQVLKFNDYILRFNKIYSGEERDVRLQNFKESLADIARRNAIEGATVFGLTQFSDMSAQEFADRMLMKPTLNRCQNIKEDNCDRFSVIQKPGSGYTNSTLSAQTFSDLPLRFDWRDDTRRMISPVFNQKQCLACWSISIIESMEAMSRKHEISQDDLSAQELLDCSTYNKKCKGGNVATALQFLCRKRWSIVTEKEYPLTLADQTCDNETRTATGVRVKSFKHMCNMSEHEMLREIVDHGPLIAIVNAAPLINYIGGIIRWACAPPSDETTTLHAVQIVGFDRRGGIPYYIVKNSWGELFGDHGYMKLAINGNVCGIAEEVSKLDVERSP